MIVSLSLVLLVAAFSYYVYFLLTVNKGLRSLKVPMPSSYRPFVSVVIAARNEEQTIGKCLASVREQDYPHNLYEIIVVDDHSIDGTAQITKVFAAQQNQPVIKLLQLQHGSAGQGKPAAIAVGVRHSDGEIILCTDADCVVSSKWISSMVQCFQPGVAFVAGPVTEEPGSTFFSKLQALEFFSLITTGAGLIGAGTPIICNGANIGYRKSAFEAVNGYGEHSTSCDDETLMQRIATRSIGQVIFNSNVEATVGTKTNPSMLQFWNQRTRWASKRGHYEDQSILHKLILLYLFFVIFFAVALFALFQPELLFPVIIIFFAKLVIDFQTLRIGVRLFKGTVPLSYFIIAELLHVPYIVLAAGIGQIGSFRWKDRVLNK